MGKSADEEVRDLFAGLVSDNQVELAVIRASFHKAGLGFAQMYTTMLVEGVPREDILVILTGMGQKLLTQ